VFVWGANQVNGIAFAEGVNNATGSCEIVKVSAYRVQA